MQLFLDKKEEILKEAEVICQPVLADQKLIKTLIKSFDFIDQKNILTRLDKENFSGQKNKIFAIHNNHQLILLIGTGQAKKLASEDWRQCVGLLVQYLKKYSSHSLGFLARHWLKGSGDYFNLGKSLAEGLTLAAYDFDKYKKSDSDQIKLEIDKIIICLNPSQKAKFKKGWEQGLIFAQGTILARDLVNEPAGQMTPTVLANQAEVIAKAHKNISVKILTKEDCQKLGMNAFLGVDQGSDEPLKFIHLIYKPQNKKAKKIALVGKGITFDSGGLNLKPGDGMSTMKCDMGGAATVLGIFSVLGRLNPKVEVHGIIAACENMPSGRALKPGDIVANMDGTTIEIGNTDAEGRVTLADALAYAQKQGIKIMVDFATLTGACPVALGPQYVGLFANDDKMAKELLASGQKTGEKLWRLPLPEEYKELNKSQVADINNIPNTRWGGAITAALFLYEFIKKDVKLSHWDIAGPALAEKPFNSYTPSGGTGVGVRAILDWLL